MTKEAYRLRCYIPWAEQSCGGGGSVKWWWSPYCEAPYSGRGGWGPIQWPPTEQAPPQLYRAPTVRGSHCTRAQPPPDRMRASLGTPLPVNRHTPVKTLSSTCSRIQLVKSKDHDQQPSLNSTWIKVEKGSRKASWFQSNFADQN